MENLTIGFALTGSFCTIEEVLNQMKQLVDAGNKVIPILSFAVAHTDTRFGKAAYFKEKIIEITGVKPIQTIEDAEPVGPQKLLDILLVSPCTGNTLSKIANAVTDTPVTMACKAHLRNLRPVVLAISTNDGLSANAKNIGALLNRKNIYFVPFGQDNPINKCNSLIADYSLTVAALEKALEGKQLQPLLLGGK
ncbi:MAG: dipicolinate synthase subunit B [Christensenellales bacterium]